MRVKVAEIGTLERPRIGFVNRVGFRRFRGARKKSTQKSTQFSSGQRWVHGMAPECLVQCPLTSTIECEYMAFLQSTDSQQIFIPRVSAQAQHGEGNRGGRKASKCELVLRGIGLFQ